MLTKKHRIKRVKWAKKYMKVKISKVIFTDECSATVDGPDGWSRGSILEGAKIQTRQKRPEAMI